MAYQRIGFLTQLAYLPCSAFSSQETIKLDSDYREVLQQPETRMPGPDIYWFRNDIYMHRLFLGVAIYLNSTSISLSLFVTKQFKEM